MSTITHEPRGECAAGALPLDEEHLTATVEALKALAHPIRLGIVQLLADKHGHGVTDETCCGGDEICVCKITELFNVSMATISHHLKLLREAGLVEARRNGAWINYSLRRDQLSGVAQALEHIATLGPVRAQH